MGDHAFELDEYDTAVREICARCGIDPKHIMSPKPHVRAVGRREGVPGAGRVYAARQLRGFAGFSIAAQMVMPREVWKRGGWRGYS